MYATDEQRRAKRPVDTKTSEDESRFLNQALWGPYQGAGPIPSTMSELLRPGSEIVGPDPSRRRAMIAFGFVFTGVFLEHRYYRV